MGQRTPLSRERALAAAVDYADEHGVEAVTMRSLAAELDVVPMALYKHVRNKEDLLGGMVDRVIAEYRIPEPCPGDAWSAALRTAILSARESLLVHPWLRSVIDTRTTRSPTVLRYMDALAGVFFAGGFSAELTHHAMHILGHRIWGFNPEAFTEMPGGERGVAGRAESPPTPGPDEVARFAEAFPHIFAITVATTGGDLSLAGAGCDEQFEFEFSLDLLLDAFERLRDGAARSR